MSGSITSAIGHGPGSTRVTSMPRCCSAETISIAIGPDSTTTAYFTVSMYLSHSIASRMFFTW